MNANARSKTNDVDASVDQAAQFKPKINKNTEKLL